MIKYIIRVDLNVILFSLIGTVATKELVEKVQFLKIRDKINVGTNIVIDTREQINVFTRDEVLKIFFEMVGADKNPLIKKTAILTVSKEEFGTGRLYSAYKNKTKVEVVVFTDLKNASQWLEIPKDKTFF